MERAILATLAYADIFDYPLTLSQLHHFLIGCKLNQKELRKVLNQLVQNQQVGCQNAYYFLPGRAHLVALRLKRAKLAPVKLALAKEAATILKVLPQVKLIGVSGSVAVNNADWEDDIDFFIITAAGQLWLTRFFSTAILTVLAKRRTPQAKTVANKICLNMFVDESQLEIIPHNLYLAHEVLQMRPLFWRDYTYERFLAANQWAYQFLPNWPRRAAVNRFDSQLVAKPPWLMTKAEDLAKQLQLAYMAKRRTIEKITAGKIQFHPRNTQHLVMDAYGKRLKDLGILRS